MFFQLFADCSRSRRDHDIRHGVSPSLPHQLHDPPSRGWRQRLVLLSLEVVVVVVAVVVVVVVVARSVNFIVVVVSLLFVFAIIDFAL